MDTLLGFVSALAAVVGIPLSVYFYRKETAKAALRDVELVARERDAAARALLVALNDQKIASQAQKIAIEFVGRGIKENSVWHAHEDAHIALKNLSFTLQKTILSKKPNFKESLWKELDKDPRSFRVFHAYAEMINELIKQPFDNIDTLAKYDLANHRSIVLYQSAYALLTNRTHKLSSENAKLKYKDLGGREWETSINAPTK
ncbi:hypothetical protein [Phyllobacterium sp. YR531]|uniref:hypothetical protein n=1 Tax=Phyllobacterium sp. YR531 TaxID=1144343 RepID=UPI00026FBB62|nr:hypothetical protein [Phyllobacterium sp. YR531]EJM99834.1 hypothetical protein PMI41_03726 [Phyllobacterium sp. YR531]